jgi:hypothetical protein
MLARTQSYTTLGLEALSIEIEVHTAPGLPSMTIIGLPDQAVREARERVKSALENSQFRIPSQRITINLAPADVRKEGGYFTNLPAPAQAPRPLVQPRQPSGRKGCISQNMVGRMTWT